jgi:hypothetical protein
MIGTHCDLIQSRNPLNRNRYINEAEAVLRSLADSQKLRYNENILRITTTDLYSDLAHFKSLLSILRSNVSSFIYKKRGITASSSSSNDNTSSSPSSNDGLAFTMMRLQIEEEKKKERKYMMWDEYLRLFADFNITNEEQIKSITQSLVNFGAILTYRQYNSGAGSLVIIDPVWLATAFTSIISISFQSSALRRGYFKETNLHSNWRNKSIDESVWPHLLRLFETLCLIVKRPNNEYYVPAMLHTPHQLSQNDFVEVERRNQYIADHVPAEYQCMCRSYEFSVDGGLPFGFIDRLVVRLMQYPEMDVQLSTWIDDYYLSSSSSSSLPSYHLRIQRIGDHQIRIILYHPPFPSSSSSSSSLASDSWMSFFIHFVFESPHVIVQSYMQSSIKRVNIIPSLNDERTEYISEDQIIAMIMNSNLLFANHTNDLQSLSSLSEAEIASILSSLPDFLVRDIARFDLSNYMIEKKIGKGGFGTIWLAAAS